MISAKKEFPAGWTNFKKQTRRRCIRFLKKESNETRRVWTGEKILSWIPWVV